MAVDSPRTIIYPVLVIAAVALVAVAISWMAAPRSDRAQPHSVAEVDGSQTATRFAPVGVVLTTAPDAKPGIDAAEAIRAAVADGIRPDVQLEGAPQATLDFLTKDLKAPANELTTSKPTVNLLVWDIVYRDAPQELRGPADAPQMQAAPCDLHILVDATSGEVLEGFQTGCSVTDNPGPAAAPGMPPSPSSTAP